METMLHPPISPYSSTVSLAISKEGHNEKKRSGALFVSMGPRAKTMQSYFVFRNERTGPRVVLRIFESPPEWI